MSAVFELQIAMVAALKNSATLQSLIGNPIRLYDDVPAPVEFPYATIGQPQQLPDKAECIDGSEIFRDIHVWSRARGSREVTDVAAAITNALDEVDLTLPSHRCLLIERDDIRFLIDPDGLTRHAVITFRALTEPLN